MPEVTGIEFLQALRASGNDVRFGFVTSESTDAMRATAEAGRRAVPHRQALHRRDVRRAARRRPRLSRTTPGPAAQAPLGRTGGPRARAGDDPAAAAAGRVHRSDLSASPAAGGPVYTLVSASVLALDLARHPSGAAVADVVDRALVLSCVDERGRSSSTSSGPRPAHVCSTAADRAPADRAGPARRQSWRSAPGPVRWQPTRCDGARRPARRPRPAAGRTSSTSSAACRRASSTSSSTASWPPGCRTTTRRCCPTSRR